MTTTTLRTATAAILLAMGMLHTTSAPARAASASEISESARNALDALYAKQPAARVLGEKARGVLVFPSIVKGGFIFGAEYGDGALFKYGRVSAYYNTTGVSYGFQAGLQKYGYALFFMTDSALRYLNKSDGFELGAGPSLTVVDEGFAKKMTTTTLRSDVYAFVFSQKGLMGGIGLQGTKITRIHPK
jgi:lipid-binding SYLF domain-containing protein